MDIAGEPLRSKEGNILNISELSNAMNIVDGILFLFYLEALTFVPSHDLKTLVLGRNNFQASFRKVPDCRDFHPRSLVFLGLFEAGKMT